MSPAPKKGRGPVVVRYRLQSPCPGLFDSADPSIIPRGGLATTFNSRVRDGIVISRGGQEKRNTDAMDGSVFGMIDTEGEFDLSPSVVIDPGSYIGWEARVRDDEGYPYSGEWVGLPYDHLIVTCANDFTVQWTSTVLLYPSNVEVVTVGPTSNQYPAFPLGGVVPNDYPPDAEPPDTYSGRSSNGLRVEDSWTPDLYEYRRVPLSACYPSGLVPWVGVNPGIDLPPESPVPYSRYGDGPNVNANRDPGKWLPTNSLYAAIIPDPWVLVNPIQGGYVPDNEYASQAAEPPLDTFNPTNYIYLYYDECQFTCTVTDIVTSDTAVWESPTYFAHEHLYWWRGPDYP